MPKTAPLPESLAAALAPFGLRGHMVIERSDGAPLTESDEKALRFVVECHDAESGRAVSDEDAMRLAATALPTGTGGQ